MPADHAATIVNHLRSIMGNSEWRFHGPSIERIVCRAVDAAKADAIKYQADSGNALIQQASDRLAALQDQIVEDRAARLAQEGQ